MEAATTCWTRPSVLGLTQYESIVFSTPAPLFNLYVGPHMLSRTPAANDRRPRFMQSAEEGFGCCGSLGGSKGGFGALWGGSRRWVGWLVVWLVFGWWKMGLGMGRGAIFSKRCIRDCARCLHFLSSRSRVGPFLVFFKKSVPRYSFRHFFWKCCSRYSVVLFYRKGAQKLF